MRKTQDYEQINQIESTVTDASSPTILKAYTQQQFRTS